MDTLFDFTGRRALITGGNRGIGRAVAEAFASRGAEVAVHFHSDESAADQVVAAIADSGGSALTVQADLADRSSVNSMLDDLEHRWGRLDVLVNNAGDMLGRSPLDEADDQLVDTVLNINLKGCVDVIRRGIPLLRKGTNAAIVNMTSISAYNGGQGGIAPYATAKAGILGLTRALARELGPTIRVNAVAPGVILTDMHRRLSTPELLEQIATRTPLGRNGEPADVAGIVLLLAGPAGSFITGEVVHVNGGLWMA